MINAVSQAINTAIPQEVPEELKSYLEKDVFVFSGLKTHAQLTEARQYLKDPKGNIVPYYQFEKKVTALNKTYNKNYLEAEYLFAQQSAQSAANWADHSDDTSRYLLQYRTAADDHVRASHQPLHNITLPKNHPFWKYYYAPNGWRCRCHVVEVLAGDHPATDPDKAIKEGEKATTQIEKTGVNKLAMFRFNPGIEQKVFPPKNSYTKVVGAERAKKEVEKVFNNSKLEELKHAPENLAEYEKTLGIKVNRDVFKLLNKPTPLTFTNPNGMRSVGAYYLPSRNIVKIPFDDRRKSSKWYAEAVVYHEFGHAADHQNNLKTRKEVTGLMREYRKRIDFGSVDKKLIALKNRASKNNNKNLEEKVGAVRDAIMSLNQKHGYGHKKAYWRVKGNKEAEFLAHAFENTFAGNEVFKKYLPELYDDTLKLINGFMQQQ